GSGINGRFAELCRRPFPTRSMAETGDPIFTGLPSMEALGVKPAYRQQAVNSASRSCAAGFSSPFPTAHLAGVERYHPCLQHPSAAVVAQNQQAGLHYASWLRFTKERPAPEPAQPPRAAFLPSPPPPSAWLL